MKIEIWSDIACPWCYIGKRRFESALAEFSGKDEVELVWRSFELDPGAPPVASETLDEILSRKYRMSPVQARQMQAQVAEVAAQEGLEFRFDHVKPVNTFDAHRLIHLAHDHGLQDSMKERLLQAYFTEGISMSDHDALVKLATEVGLDSEATRNALSSGAFSEAVRADEQKARELGIQGVPFFLIEGEYGLSGAKPTALLRRALESIHDTTDGDSESGPSCDDDGCAL